MRKKNTTPYLFKAAIPVVLALLLVVSGVAGIADDQNEFTIQEAQTIGGGRSWSDNFDSYVLDQFLDGTPDDGGWKGWDNASAAGAYVVNDYAHSSPHSVEIVGGSDLVHEYKGYTAGQWTYTAWVYIPEDFNGLSYFIMLSGYTDGGGSANTWTVQVRFDSGLGIVESEFDGSTLTLITGQWVELRVEIDLDGDWFKIFYDSEMLVEKEWSATVQGTGGGPLVINAVDLFANAASEVYYDDMSLEEGISLSCDADGPYEGVVGEEIQFDGTVSGGVPPYDYEWDFGTGDYAYVEDPIYSYDDAGEYTVWFNVTDDAAGSASDSTTVTITAPEPLIADAGGPYEGLVDETIQFTGSATGGTPPYTYEWDFGDGNTSDEQNPQHAYAVADDYTLTLTVTDSIMETDDDTTTATIIEDISTDLEITAITGGMGGVTATIKNAGDNPATVVEWHIYVEGGFLGLIDIDATDTIAEIAAAGEEDVPSGSLGFLRLGPIDIEVTAEAENADKVTASASGFVIGPFVLISG